MARTTVDIQVPEIAERDYTQKDRDAMDDGNFGDPENQAFPIKTAQDVINAASLLHNAKGDQSAIKSRIIRIANRKGFPLPQTWQDDPKESVATIAHTSPAAQPRSRIATIQVCWISDGAESLNKRIYPASTVDKLIASGQRKIANPNGLPVTCFLSHADADDDHTPALIGKVVRIWREGSKGMADIDLADTSHARDALGLISGGYIRTESLRASNAELRVDGHYNMPIVAGDGIELDGIDLTNYPGLEQVARIERVRLAESSHTHPPLTETFSIAPQAVAIHEVFHAHTDTLVEQFEQKEGFMPEKKPVDAATQPASAPLTEAGDNKPVQYSPTSGNTVGVTSDPTQDAYAQRMYAAPPMTSGTMQGMAQAPEIMEAHDRIAMVQGRDCAPARESARWAVAYSRMSESDRKTITEKGKSLSTKNDAHLDVAHDALAKHAGMTCEGVNNKKSTDPDNDGDDDSTNDPMKNPDWADDQTNQQNNMESKPKGKRTMSVEEARKLLEANGYTGFQAPKTDAEKFREEIAAMQQAMQEAQKQKDEAYAKQIEEMRALITPQVSTKIEEAAPQRKSMVSGSNVTGNSTSIRSSLYSNGKYLKEQISNADWEQLADRTCPIPDGLNIDHLIREFEQLYAVQYDNRFQVLSATELR